MSFWRKKSRKEKIIELEAKIAAWERTWGSLKEKIEAFQIEEYENMLAKVYELRKLEKAGL